MKQCILCEIELKDGAKIMKTEYGTDTCNKCFNNIKIAGNKADVAIEKYFK